MQISNTFVSIANYTPSFVKSGISYGTSAIGFLGRVSVSILKTGASFAGKTVQYARSFFSGSASYALKAVTKNPKISITLGLLAGTASIVLIAKKRFNICALEKLSGYCPSRGKKTENENHVEEVKADAAEQVVDAHETDAMQIEDVLDANAEDTPTESVSSQAPSRAESPISEPEAGE